MNSSNVFDFFKTNWFKVGIILILVYLMFAKDLSFTVYFGDKRTAVIETVESDPVITDLPLEDDSKETTKLSPENPIASKAPPKKKAPPKPKYKTVSYVDWIKAKDPSEFKIDPKDVEPTLAYIERFSTVAISEQAKFGIPASISGAQGILETRSGTSSLATKNNNHFGMKCFSKKCKKGHCSNYGDDTHKDFFRKYESAWHSWRAHSQLLSNGRYEHLLEFGTDYKKWAHGLKKAGYATDKLYAEKLIRYIEFYELWRFDSVTSTEPKFASNFKFKVEL